MCHSNKEISIEYYDVLSSTNDVARDNLTHLRVIVADYQTNGRGQRANIWDAEKGSSILATLVYELKYGKDLDSAKLSLMTAQAIVNVIEREYSLKLTIKHPNDILISGKKLCGILIEVVNGFAIVGFGINISDYPKNCNATSLLEDFSSLEDGQFSINKDLLLREILDEIVLIYEQS